MNIFKLSSTALLLSSAFIITGCGSGGGGSADASVPANAVVIDAENAEEAIAGSFTSVNTFNSVFGVEITPTLGVLAALDLIQPRIDDAKDALHNSGADLTYGVAVSESGNCEVSGTFSFTGDEGGSYPSFTDSGTVTVTNCDDGAGFTMTGSIHWVESWNNETGDYSDTTTANLSMVFDQGPAFNFTGLNMAETGNDFDGTYVITQGTFGLDFVVNGVSGGGYLVQLAANIVESSGGFYSCPESGHIIVTGANGSTAEGIYNGDNTMTIKANGEVVNATAACPGVMVP